MEAEFLTDSLNENHDGQVKDDDEEVRKIEVFSEIFVWKIEMQTIIPVSIDKMS